jgi:hypothetical protein
MILRVVFDRGDDAGPLNLRFYVRSVAGQRVTRLLLPTKGEHAGAGLGEPNSLQS